MSRQQGPAEQGLLPPNLKKRWYNFGAATVSHMSQRGIGPKSLSLGAKAWLLEVILALKVLPGDTVLIQSSLCKLPVISALLPDPIQKCNWQDSVPSFC